MHAHTSWCYYSQVWPSLGTSSGLIALTPWWRAPDSRATSSGGSEPSFKVLSQLYHWQHHHLDGKCRSKGIPSLRKGDALSKADHQNPPPQPARHLYQMLQVKGKDFQQSRIHLPHSVLYCMQLSMWQSLSLLLSFRKLCPLEMILPQHLLTASTTLGTDDGCVHRVYLMLTAWQRVPVTFQFCSSKLV